VKIGLFCTTPMVALTRAIGRKRAMEMLLTGDFIDAETAAEWGLVNRVVAPERSPPKRARSRSRSSRRADSRSGSARRVLRADRSRSAQGVRLREGSDEHERARRGRARGHRRISRTRAPAYGSSRRRLLRRSSTTLGFFWDSLYGLIFGFLISAIAQTTLTRGAMERFLGPNLRGVLNGAAFGRYRVRVFVRRGRCVARLLSEGRRRARRVRVPRSRRRT
jgi:hypothetical protein